MWGCGFLWKKVYLDSSSHSCIRAGGLKSQRLCCGAQGFTMSCVFAHAAKPRWPLPLLSLSQTSCFGGRADWASSLEIIWVIGDDAFSHFKDKLLDRPEV